MWVAMRRRFRNADLDGQRLQVSLLRTSHPCTYSGLGWPQKPAGPRALALPCHLMFPWSCADTGSFTFSMERWSSKIRSSVRKSASRNTDAPVWFAESLEAQVEEGSRRRCTGQRASAGPLQPTLRVSLPTKILSACHQKNSWAFSRVQEKGLIPWKAWVDGYSLI